MKAIFDDSVVPLLQEATDNIGFMKRAFLLTILWSPFLRHS
jgi:hypothetical protein